MSTGTPYSDKEIERIGKMLRDGMSASQVGSAVGRSRAAICGLVVRRPELKPTPAEKLSAISIEASRKRGTRGGMPAKPHAGNIVGKKLSRAKDPVFVDRAAPVAGALMLPLEALEPRDGCRFIFGDPSSALYCGLPGFPWCEGHRRLVYTPAIVRRAAA